MPLEALRLRLHPIKSQIRRCNDGTSFVGFHVLSDRIRVRNHTLSHGHTWRLRRQAFAPLPFADGLP